MSHTRGKDPTNPGKFAFECFDWTGAPFRTQGGFETAQEADRAAAAAEREMTLLATGGNLFGIGLTSDGIDTMSDDALLAELLGGEA